MTDGPQEEPMSAAERRVVALLALLRSDLVTSRPGLVAGIMRQVRWQRVLRDVVGAVGTFASSLAHGITVLIPRAEKKNR